MQSREVFEMSIPEVRAYCDSLPTDADRESCTLGALGRFLFVSVRPVQFCQDIPTSEPGRRDLCYRAAFFWTERITSSTDIDVICRADESCRIEYEKYLAVKSTLPDYRLGIWGGR